MAKDWAIELIDRALNERNFAYLADLIRKSDPSPKVRDHLATVVLGLLTGKIKESLFPRPSCSSLSSIQVRRGLKSVRRRRRGTCDRRFDQGPRPDSASPPYPIRNWHP